MSAEGYDDREDIPEGRCGHPTPHGKWSYCGRDAAYPDGYCYQHSDHSANDAGRAGRPDKLNPAMQSRVCDFLARGHSVQVAATMAGIHYDTYRRWRKRGEAALQNGERGRFAEFYARTERARIEGMKQFEDIVIEETMPVDAEGRFGKSMEILRKRWPHVWGGDADDGDRGGDLTVQLGDGGEVGEGEQYAKSPEDAR